MRTPVIAGSLFALLSLVAGHSASRVTPVALGVRGSVPRSLMLGATPPAFRCGTIRDLVEMLEAAAAGAPRCGAVK